MDKSFGVICEGPSDFIVIKRIIEVFFKNEDVFINCVQPKIFPTEKSDFGGWSRVIKCCSDNTLSKVFEYNDYAIIQIDSDHTCDSPLNISKIDEKGKTKPIDNLLDEIIDQLNCEIKKNKENKYDSKILFAICIQSLECWLLPVLFSDKHAKCTDNCLYILNKAVQKKFKKYPVIHKKNKNDEGRKVYEELIRYWKKRKDIETSSKCNIGFKYFVKSLDKIL